MSTFNCWNFNIPLDVLHQNEAVQGFLFVG